MISNTEDKKQKQANDNHKTFGSFFINPFYANSYSKLFCVAVRLSQTIFKCNLTLFYFIILHQTVVNWDNDKLVCVQKGEKKNRGWTHWIQDGELHLVYVYNVVFPLLTSQCL